MNRTRNDKHGFAALSTGNLRSPVTSGIRRPSRLGWLSCLFVLLTGCSDVVASRHATLADARSDIERGWIPPVLPASTVRIRESHDLDTNVGHGTFAFGAADSEPFRDALEPMPLGEPIRRAHVRRGGMEQAGYSFYRHRDFYIAVDWSRRRGEFWLAYPSPVE